MAVILTLSRTQEGGYGGLVEGVSKIAVLRANRLGDFIVSLPALEALRAAYRHAEITLLGLDWHAAFLKNRPASVDRVVVVPPSRGVRDEADAPGEPDRLADFFRAMQHERFDVAVQMHGGGRYSNPFVLSLGAGLTAGLKAPDAPALDRWVAYAPSQPEVMRFLEVAALLGGAAATVEPRLAVAETDLAEARVLLGDSRSPLVAMHPGAIDARRRWSAEKFAAVGDALARAGATVLITGAAEERAVVARVSEAMRAEVLDLSGRLSVGGLAGVFSRCLLVVSNDTGPAHLASAVGAATVTVFWCGNFVNWAPLTRARHRPAISWRVSCQVCGASAFGDACSHEVSLVDDVPTDEVIALALDLLAQERERSSV